MKRIALALAALAVIAVLGLFAAAHRPGAGHNQASVVIDAPAGEVFAYFTDFEQVKRWVPMLKDVKWVRGERIEAGAIARLTMEGAEQDEEFLAVEPGKRLAMKLTGTHGEYEEHCEYRFEENGGRTTVTVQAQTRYHGVFFLLEPVITPAADKALGQLKTLASR